MVRSSIRPPRRRRQGAISQRDIAMEDTALILILTAVAALAGGALFSAIALLPDRTRVSPQPPQPPPDTTVSIRAPSSGRVVKTSVSTGRPVEGREPRPGALARLGRRTGLPTRGRRNADKGTIPDHSAMGRGRCVFNSGDGEPPYRRGCTTQRNDRKSRVGDAHDAAHVWVRRSWISSNRDSYRGVRAFS